MNGFRRDEETMALNTLEWVKRQDRTVSAIGYHARKRDTADSELWPTTKRTFPKGRWW